MHTVPLLPADLEEAAAMAVYTGAPPGRRRRGSSGGVPRKGKRERRRTEKRRGVDGGAAAFSLMRIHGSDLEVGDKVGEKDVDEICPLEIRRNRREVVQAHVGT